MHILLVHNHYLIRGGEDSVYNDECALLEKNGHKVERLAVENVGIDSFFSKICTALNVPFSFPAYRRALKFLSLSQPDIVHVHNYFPLLSPSFFYACKKLEIPVVHTLHNYRAVCPSTFLMHDGRINESSIKNRSWWTVPKKVYRQSLIGSFALASMVELHKNIGTWSKVVDRYIALTDFAKQKYIEAGWPKEKLVVKPNFISDPQLSNTKKGGYAIFVGRLSGEKGVKTLVEAWKNIDYPLRIIGEGPLMEDLKSVNNASISLLGVRERSEVLTLLRDADFLVFPSIWYEGFPMVLIESLACGTPVLCTNIGSMKEIVQDRVTGYLFQAGDSQDLAIKAQTLIDDPKISREMGMRARTRYEQKYSEAINYNVLMGVYNQAILSNGPDPT